MCIRGTEILHKYFTRGLRVVVFLIEEHVTVFLLVFIGRGSVAGIRPGSVPMAARLHLSGTLGVRY